MSEYVERVLAVPYQFEIDWARFSTLELATEEVARELHRRFAELSVEACESLANAWSFDMK